MIELVALANGDLMGWLRQTNNGRITFTYDEAWRTGEERYPLSLSMPLVIADHPDDVVRPFLAGLLPDGDRVLEQWGRRFHVSPRNPFALLQHVGEDCAGAVQFVTPERVDAVQGNQRREITWLTESDVAERLRVLRADISAWQAPQTQGQFSLAGAQPKIALLFERGRWGVPQGRTPTTHILKPPTGAYDGFPENEHFCLQLARAIGLPTAESWVGQFEEQSAIVVTRYDRRSTRGKIVRIHQEDFCQALGVPPTRKYQSEGGPSVQDMIGVLGTYSSAVAEDLEVFVRSLAFHWVIGASDAHAKNYALLLGLGGEVRLAPLYDIITTLPYDTIDPQRVKLAMKIGGEYQLHRIGPRQWRTLAVTAHLDDGYVLDLVRDVVAQVGEGVHRVRQQGEREGVRHEIVSQIEHLIADRVRQCESVLHPKPKQR